MQEKDPLLLFKKKKKAKPPSVVQILVWFCTYQSSAQQARRKWELHFITEDLRFWAM